MAGNEVIVKPEITGEFAILDQAGDHVQTDFGKQGDSGSVLIDRFGRVSGLLYGLTRTYAGINLTAYGGLAMTMHDAHETIKVETYSNDDRYAILEL